MILREKQKLKIAFSLSEMQDINSDPDEFI